MEQHVYERAKQVPSAHAPLVGIDHAREAAAVQAFGDRCIMTSRDRPSGTDEVSQMLANWTPINTTSCESTSPCDLAGIG